MARFGGPPVDYLRECSNTSLRYFEISKLEHVANLRRELAVLMDEMMEESALALFARWMLERRANLPHASGNGCAARGAESRKARSLLADFIRGAGLMAPSPHGPSGRTRPDDKGMAQPPPESGTPGEMAAREHASPHRGEARTQRRLERRGSRAARPSPRPSAQSG